MSKDNEKGKEEKPEEKPKPITSLLPNIKVDDSIQNNGLKGKEKPQ